MRNEFISRSFSNMMSKDVGIGTTCILSDLKSPFVTPCNKTEGFFEGFTTDYQVQYSFINMIGRQPTIKACLLQGIGVESHNCSCSLGFQGEETTWQDIRVSWGCRENQRPKVPSRQIQNTSDVLFDLTSVNAPSDWILNTYKEFIETR